MKGISLAALATVLILIVLGVYFVSEKMTIAAAICCGSTVLIAGLFCIYAVIASKKAREKTRSPRERK